MYQTTTIELLRFELSTSCLEEKKKKVAFYAKKTRLFQTCNEKPTVDLRNQNVKNI
jgi:hypothetical protein